MMNEGGRGDQPLVITKCENRFEVVVGDVDAIQIQNITWALLEWLKKKEVPTDESYMAAMGDCGK